MDTNPWRMTEGVEPYEVKASRTVLNGGREETCRKVTRLAPTHQPCEVKASSTVRNGGGEETYLCLLIWQRALPLPTKAGWYAVLEDPRMPVTSTLLDQAHNTIERKLFTMKGFHHPKGSQQAFLTGLAHLYNLVPYQRRAQHAGQCGVEVEGGRVPTADWFLNLQILTSGGFRSAVTASTT